MLSERYLGAFLAVSRVGAKPHHRLLETGPLLGTVGTPDRPDGRLLVRAEDAIDFLTAMGDPWGSYLEVDPTARRCIAHLEGLGRYRSSTATAMVRELAGLTHPPVESTLRLVTATHEDAKGSALLIAAVEANLRADPIDDLTPTAFVDYLASIPGAAFLVAVDSAGIIRATAGSAVFENIARVFFVSTDLEWRGRGIGTAMTAAALRNAVDHGATHACLAASVDGYPIYRRLGFETAGDLVLFERIG